MSNYSGYRTRLESAWGTSILDADGKPWSSTPSRRSDRERARNLENESGIACGILDRSDENVIGTGIGVVPKSGDAERDAEAADLWAEWTDGKTADVRKTYSFGQLQRLAHRHKNRDGDVGFILVDRTDEGMRFPELQFVSQEHIDSPTLGRDDRSRIVDGIEYDEVNAPIAYWVRGASGYTRVDATDFVFLHSTTRYNVGRGVSKFRGDWTKYDQVEGFIEAVVVSARIGASQSLIIKRSKSKPTGVLTPRADGVPVPARIIEPGMINEIETDGDITAFNPSQPQTTFPPFLAAIAGLLGLKFGLTVERVLLMFSGVSYSGARATTLQEMLAAWPAQDDFNASFFKRVYPWFIDHCDALGYFKTARPPRPYGYEWVPPGRQLNDMVKEYAGFELGMKLGLDAPEDICTSLGWDWKKKLATIAKNKKELEDIGIGWPTDAASAAALLAQPEQQPPVTASQKGMQ